jgi:mRNA-degrading endonuclease toxin of MazEF toxin-antitoxin module
MPNRREMIWVDYSSQVGAEMKAEHPMLVLATKAFNERTGIVIRMLRSAQFKATQKRVLLKLLTTSMIFSSTIRSRALARKSHCLRQLF